MIERLSSHSRWPFVRAGAAVIMGPGEAHVLELQEQGKGRIDFPDDRHVLFARPVNDNMPLLWFYNDECADGAFVIEENNELTVHLVEMKSTVNAGKWATSRLQFEGMLANALAVLGYLGETNVVNVVCHLALKKQTIARSLDASPSLRRPLIGVAAYAAGGNGSAAHQFQSQLIDILDRKNVEVRYIWRDEDGNGKGAFS